MNLAQLIARREELETINQGFLARLEGGEELTDEEVTQLDANVEEFDSLSAQIEQRERINAQTATLAEPQGRRTAPAPVAGTSSPTTRVGPGVRRAMNNGTQGFDDFGQFSQAIIHAAVNPSDVDARLLAAGQGNQVGVGADGGYLVPPDFREIIMEKVTTEDSLLGRTDGLQTSANTVTIPKSSVEQWGATGVQGYWTAEGGAITKSKAAFGQTALQVQKLACLVPVTEEQMEDGPLIDSYLRRKVPDKLDWMISDAIINGDGVGKPLGILDATAAGTLALTRVASAAEVVLYEDVLAMWGRCYAPWRGNSIWLINPAVEEKLNALAFDAGATNPVPAYMPAGGLSASPYGTLMGRPVVPHQACQAAGAKGDIILADMNQYLTVTKVNGMRTDVSMHIYFDTDELAFRFIMRVGGEPWWDAVIDANNGTYDQAAFVTLAAGS